MSNSTRFRLGKWILIWFSLGDVMLCYVVFLLCFCYVMLCFCSTNEQNKIFERNKKQANEQTIKLNFLLTAFLCCFFYFNCDKQCFFSAQLYIIIVIIFFIIIIIMDMAYTCWRNSQLNLNRFFLWLLCLTEKFNSIQIQNNKYKITKYTLYNVPNGWL